jgi:hypothetical protein
MGIPAVIPREKGEGGEEEEYQGEPSLLTSDEDTSSSETLSCIPHNIAIDKIVLTSSAVFSASCIV